jgi:outer membrane translocation and assembly module TamA
MDGLPERMGEHRFHRRRRGGRQDLASSRRKVGMGAGVRYRSPVGPLQLDLAYGVHSKSLRLHLSVGFTF